jgi:TonB family protein
MRWRVLAAVLPALFAAATAVAEDCPAPVREPPRFPASMARSGVAGVAVVLARIDGCGRIVESRISASSGEPDLDAAALTAVAGWVLSADERARIGGAWVKLPVKFETETLYPKRVDWPKSHRRPRYVLEPDGIGHATDKDFFAARHLDGERPLKSPYARFTDRMGTRVLTSFHHDRDDAMTFWLLLQALEEPFVPKVGRFTLHSRLVAIVRYRLVQEEGEPVVRLALLCEMEPGPCAELEAELLKGLPIARAPRR